MVSELPLSRKLCLSRFKFLIWKILKCLWFSKVAKFQHWVRLTLFDTAMDGVAEERSRQ